MRRDALIELKQWVKSSSRSPLVIRGARQVGKTWLVRELAKVSGLELIEINFELDPKMKDYFTDNDPKQVMIQLEAAFGKKIDVENTLLFLDEVQSFPLILAKLRWFKEMMPELAVIATGSLLEFVLDQHEFSMPVGRISYFHLEPLSFDEFLSAKNQQMREYLKNYQWEEIPSALHEKCLRYLQEYIVVGGLPAAVKSWTEEESLVAVNQVHHDIMATYREDFARYKGRMDPALFDDVFAYIPKAVGEKIIYSRISQDFQAPAIKKAFNLISKARIVHKIKAASGNGIPLMSEVNNKFTKAICLDVGLLSGALGISLHNFKSIDDIILINKGAIAEQVTGQLLRTIDPFYIEPHLYYWQREKGSSNAEIDYLIQNNSEVLPIEVKAGTKGSMQSLHLFMGLKKLSKAVRFSAEKPSKMTIETKTSLGDLANYELLCLPIYMISQLKRLLASSS